MKISPLTLLAFLVLFVSLGCERDSKTDSQPPAKIPQKQQGNPPQESTPPTSPEPPLTEETQLIMPEPNSCIVENTGNDSFPVVFPQTVEVDPLKLAKSPNLPFVPIFHVNNTPVWYEGIYLILEPISSPTSDEQYRNMSEWEWVVLREKDHFAFKKIYFTFIPRIAVEGLQIETFAFNDQIAFVDSDTKLSFRCNLEPKDIR